MGVKKDRVLMEFMEQLVTNLLIGGISLKANYEKSILFLESDLIFYIKRKPISKTSDL
jgi:hypothetical protein